MTNFSASQLNSKEVPPLVNGTVNKMSCILTGILQFGMLQGRVGTARSGMTFSRVIQPALHWHLYGNKLSLIILLPLFGTHVPCWQSTFAQELLFVVPAHTTTQTLKLRHGIITSRQLNWLLRCTPVKY